MQHLHHPKAEVGHRLVQCPPHVFALDERAQPMPDVAPTHTAVEADDPRSLYVGRDLARAGRTVGFDLVGIAAD